MATESKSPTHTWIARAFTAVEDIVYLGLGVLLAGCAATLLIKAFVGASRSLFGGTLDNDIIGLLDRLLLILLVVELLHTVLVSFREHAIVQEPFLMIGLIAVIRRILVVTAEMGRANSYSPQAMSPFIWELAVLAALVLAIAVSLAILRRRGNGSVAEHA